MNLFMIKNLDLTKFFNPALVPWGQYDPRLTDRLNIPNFENISFHLALYFLFRFLLTVSVHSILISMLSFLSISYFICLGSY